MEVTKASCCLYVTEIPQAPERALADCEELFSSDVGYSACRVREGKKGFVAFVDYSSIEAAKAALEKHRANATSIDGTILKFDYSKNSRHSQRTLHGTDHSTRVKNTRRDYGTPCQTLFVRGIPDDATTREVAHIFRPFYGFLQVRLKPKRDHSQMCFVEFASPELAQSCVEQIQGYKMDISFPNADGLIVTFADRSSNAPQPMPGLVGCPNANGTGRKYANDPKLDPWHNERMYSRRRPLSYHRQSFNGYEDGYNRRSSRDGGDHYMNNGSSPRDSRSFRGDQERPRRVDRRRDMDRRSRSRSRENVFM